MEAKYDFASRKPEPLFEPKEVGCAKCGDKIHSRTEGEFRTCKCGAISVDQTRYYTRYIGNQEDFIIC